MSHNHEIAGSIVIQEPHLKFSGEVPIKILLQVLTTVLPDRDWSTYTYYYDLSATVDRSNERAGEYTKLSNYHQVDVGFKETGEWFEIGHEKKMHNRPWYSTPGNRIYVIVRIFKI